MEKLFGNIQLGGADSFELTLVASGYVKVKYKLTLTLSTGFTSPSFI